MKRKLYISLALLASLGVSAQQGHDHSKCQTDHQYQEQVKKDPTILERAAQFNKQAETAKASGMYAGKKSEKHIIPVVFHVFHNNGPENISKAQILDQIRILNQDYDSVAFSKLRQEFHGIAATMEIEFRLATKDPNGNCTDGILRIYDPETENGNDHLKTKSVWPTDKYFNVWVVKDINSASSTLGTVLGYAQFPWSGQHNTDGILVRSDNIGSIGTATNPIVGVQQYGRTVTHEVGHWLGLYHPFQDSCFGGDGVDDTPPVIAPSFGNCIYKNSCSNDVPDMPDMVENYMDYAEGGCMSAFTIGQKIRVKTTLHNWRPKLTSYSNLVETGVIDPYPLAGAVCGPKAYFYSVNPNACQSGKATFINNSYNYTDAATTVTFNWEFEGGTPATYTGITPPQITYAEPGTYDVKLIANKMIGTNNIFDTLIREDYVKIYATQGMYGAGMTQDFEWEGFPGTEWITRSTSARNWVRNAVGVGSIDGQFALMVQNSNLEDGAVFTLESPSYNISDAGSPVVSFYYAFEQRRVTTSTNGSNDALLVYSSTDCGQTWAQRFASSGANLATNGTSIPTTTFPFIPADKTQWKRVDASLGSIAPNLRQNVRVKFEFRSRGGNNFFIDMINMGYPTGIDNDLYLSDDKFSVYPNPTAATANVKLDLVSSGNVKVEVLDLLGKQVSILANSKMEAGEHTFTFDGSTIANGVYMVRLVVDGNTYTKKLMILNNN